MLLLLHFQIRSKVMKVPLDKISGTILSSPRLRFLCLDVLKLPVDSAAFQKIITFRRRLFFA
jgi:hypothetical protein